MASKRGKKNRFPAKRKGGSSRVSGLWKLSLIVFAIVYFRLLEIMGIRSLEFARRIMDAYGNPDYNLNFIVLCLSCAGLIMLLFSKPEKKLLTFAGGMLLLMPVWLKCETYEGSIGAAALKMGQIDLLPLAFTVGASIWFMCMVRGFGTKPQLAAALLLAAGNIVFYLLDDYPIDEGTLFGVIVFSVWAGMAIDFAYNGFSVPAVLPPVALFIELLIRYADVDARTCMYAICGVCAISALAIITNNKLRRGSAGYIAVLAGIAVNAAAGVYFTEITSLL